MKYLGLVLIPRTIIRKIARMRNRLIRIILILGLTILLAACPSSDQPNKTQATNQWRFSDILPTSMHKNIWPAMSADFRLENYDQNPAVQKIITHLKKHQDYINELTHNAKPYLYYIFQQTQKRHMPAEIALLPMVESDYNPFAYSKRGATGLWQMMPGTGSGFGLRIDWWFDGRRGIVTSTNAALKYLAYLHSYFGNWLLAIAAYDSGGGTVRAAIRYNKLHHKPTDFWSLPLPAETKRYIPKLLAFAAIIRDSKHYGLHLNAIPNKPYFTAVKLHGQMNLSHIAKLANTSTETIRKLNPGFRRWATSPKGHHWLLVPSKNASIFTANLSQPQPTHVTWLHHRVNAGENLSMLAEKFHTTTAILQRVNKINGTIIRIGQELLIPKSFHGKFTTRIEQQQKSSVAEDRIPGPKRYVHVVKAKDNLWTISARYHVKPSQLVYWNHLGYHAKLRPNQKLVIWKKGVHHKTASHAYVVQRGDNLSVIAQHFHVSIRSIKNSNGMAGDLLHIGQKLKIP